MQSAGVKYVQYIGSAQQAASIAKAMAQQNFHPIFVLDPEAYNTAYTQNARLGGRRHPHLDQRAAVRRGEPQPRDADLRAVAAAHVARCGTRLLRHVRLVGGARCSPQRGARSSAASSPGSRCCRRCRRSTTGPGNGMFGPQHVGSKITGTCYDFITLQGRQVGPRRPEQLHLRLARSRSGRRRDRRSSPTPSPGCSPVRRTRSPHPGWC